MPFNTPELVILIVELAIITPLTCILIADVFTMEHDPKIFVVLHVAFVVNDNPKGKIIMMKLLAISWLAILKDKSYWVIVFKLYERALTDVSVISPVLQANDILIEFIP